MITDPTPPPGQAPAPAASKRGPWLWVSLGLAVVAVALLIWGLSTKSDLDGTQKDLEQANQKVEQLQADAGKNTVLGGALVQAAKGPYDQLAQPLGVPPEVLAPPQQQLEPAHPQPGPAAQAAA